MNTIDPKQLALCKKDPDCEAPFHQPGSAAKYKGFSSSRPKTCPGMIARIIGDNPDITRTTFEAKCPPRSSKIALVVDEDQDYHFLRQDKSGFWSQKSGARPVTDRDARGHQIWNPQLADLNYQDGENVLNYNLFCSYLCVPRDKRLFLKVGGGTQ